MPTKKGVTFSFSEGKRFDDPYDLLEGTGKRTLNLRLSAEEEFREEVFRCYIDQAIQADA